MDNHYIPFDEAAYVRLVEKHGAEGEIRHILSRRGFNGQQLYIQQLYTGGADGHLFAVSIWEYPSPHCEALEVNGDTFYMFDGFDRPIPRRG